MESLYLLVPLSIMLALTFGYFFWWSGKNGQFDDLEGPAHRILMDDDSTDQIAQTLDPKDEAADDTQR